MKKTLKKELGLLDVFCIASGAMISSGLFILPGLAFNKTGASVVVSYILAGLFALPTLLSKAELITAMPKTGGDYFYISRSLGTALGTIAGFISWFSLSFKSAFALIGMGAYTALITHIPIHYIAVFFCLLFILVNLFGVKEAGRFQVFLVVGLIGILLFYVIKGIPFVKNTHFTPFLKSGLNSLFATAGFVFISYGGLTKVASIAEEVNNPGKNLPLGMLLSLFIVGGLYVFVVFVTIGVLNPYTLKSSLTPISDGAKVFSGNFGTIFLGIGAILAFISTANAGIMSASRYPLAMSKDRLLPHMFRYIHHRYRTPYISILFTGIWMIVIILFLRLEMLVETASTLMLLLYIFTNLAVIVMRESKIVSYRPKFHTPFYPYIQILGIIGCCFLIGEMGEIPLVITTVFFISAFLWYFIYVHFRVKKESALLYLLERLVGKDQEFLSSNLSKELKDIIVTRDEIIEDRFDALIKESEVLDIKEQIKMEEFFEMVSQRISKQINIDTHKVLKKFIHREQISTTVIRKGLAIPHIMIDGKNIFKILLARSNRGILFTEGHLVHAVFVLISSKDQRNLHLKVLAAIAQITQDIRFDKQWLSARNKDEIKHIVLLGERKRFLKDD